MKNKIKHSTTEKNAGKKQGSRAKSQQSYIIYNNCYDCPLRVYIELVCNNNLDALVVSGEPTHEELIDASNKLLTEFSQLSGNSTTVKYNLLMKEIYMYRSQIIALTVCSRLLLLNATEIAIQNLNSIGLRCSLPETEEETEEISKKIIGKIKERSIRLKTAQKNFDAIKSNGKPISIKPSDFIDQLVVLSKWVGFRLTTEITLYEYASYMKRMNEYAESLKMKSLKNG